MGIFKKITGRVFAGNMKRGAQAASDICYAAETGDVAKLKKLFKGATYEECDSIANYALIAACEAGQVETARFLLDFGVPTDIIILSGDSPARAAARNDQPAILALLLDHTVKGGGEPAPALVEALAEVEKKRRQQAAADAPDAAILQRNIKTRKKPLNFKSKKP